MERTQQQQHYTQTLYSPYNAIIIPTGKFQRSIKLPVNADVSAITAKFVDGVLSLEVPKKDPAPERKEITID